MKPTVKTSNLSITNKRKVKVFLFILVLTSIIWLLIQLSKVNTSTAVFNVVYKNIPTGKLLQSKPISEVTITLKAPGFSLLKYKIKKNKVVLNLKNVVKNKTNYYLLPNKQKAYLNAQLSGDTEVVSVLNDTIFVDLGNNKSKKVPVVPLLKINFKLGYNLTENLKIVPDSVTITGPEKYIDSIRELSNSPIQIKDVYQNISQEINLKLPLNKMDINFSTTKVTISGKVDKFTEGNFTIPVIIINKPKGVKINTFPNEINVIYQAGLSNFNKITTKSFTIVYDYEEYEKDTLVRHLTPIIKQKSEFISSLKTNPSQIEFLIQNGN